MSIGQAYRYFMFSDGQRENPYISWCFSLIAVSMCCGFFPAMFVLLGYLAVVGRALRDDPERKTVALFERNQVSKYASEGLWQLIPLIVFFGIAYTTGFVAIHLRAKAYAWAYREITGPNATLLLDVLVASVTVPVAVATCYVLWPFLFHIHISGKLRPMAAFAFVSLMSAKVGGRMFLLIPLQWMLGAALFYMISWLILPIPFIIATVVFAQEHLMVQLYRLYLERGGVPIADIGREADDWET
ncbi:MAG: hypothetical protein ACRC8S_04550 [Fimbriiglobus sp.]